MFHMCSSRENDESTELWKLNALSNVVGFFLMPRLLPTENVNKIPVTFEYKHVRGNVIPTVVLFTDKNRQTPSKTDKHCQ